MLYDDDDPTHLHIGDRNNVMARRLFEPNFDVAQIKRKLLSGDDARTRGGYFSLNFHLR